MKEPGALSRSSNASSLEALRSASAGSRRSRRRFRRRRLDEAWRRPRCARRPGAAARRERRDLGRPVPQPRRSAQMRSRRRLRARRAGLAVRPGPGVRQPAFWEPVFERVNGDHDRAAPRRAGCSARGSSATQALPKGHGCSTETQLNIVTAGTDLGFAVTVENTGDIQEVQVKVTITIQQQPSPIVATQTIALDQPGRAEDRHVQEPRPGGVRDEDDRSRSTCSR